MRDARVRVRRERPTALAWSIALAVTMLAVYAATCSSAMPTASELAASAPRVTREARLDALEGWCVALGTWEDAARARVEAAGLTAQGAAGRVYPGEGGYRVLGAMYDTERQARRVADRLTGDGLQAGVVPLTAEAVTLRITAPEAQIELIEAADKLLREQAGRLCDMAGQVDKGQLRPDAAKTLCALTATEAGSLAERLRIVSGGAGDGLCAALTERLAALADQLAAVSDTAQTAPANIAGMLRAAQIDDVIGLVEMREEMLKTG